MFGGYQNPFAPANQFYNPMMQQQPQQLQPQQVTRVNGENGARAYQIGPNSSALLLDESGVLVWLVTSDGAGYKSIAPYDITPHQAAPALDFGSLETRIAKLEAMMNERTAANTTAATGSKPNGGEHVAD